MISVFTICQPLRVASHSKVWKCTLKGSPAALQTAGASWRSGGVNGVGSNHFVRLLSTTLTFSPVRGLMLLVASPPVQDLLLFAKDLFVAAKIGWHELQVIAR
jgi:hypothetical protein